MSKTLNEILKKYVEDVHKIYGEKLRTVILYGSYARGDFRTDSDIDIMIKGQIGKHMPFKSYFIVG